MPENRGPPAAGNGAGTRTPLGALARWGRRVRSRKVIVRDRSMEPTFLPGDRLFVDLAAYRTAPVRRDDLVVVADPVDPGRLLLKRVVGVAGDFVRVTHLGAERTTAPTHAEAPPPSGSLEEVEVPPAQVFLLSDRPARARDSRQFGPVSVRLVLGRVWRRYAPPGRTAEF